MSDSKHKLSGKSNCSASEGSKPLGKLAYARPTLSVYGSVRELTGSVSGVGPGDGATMMT